MSDSDSEDNAAGATGGGGSGSRKSPDNPLALLQEKLKGLSAAYDLVVKNSNQLMKIANMWESGGGGGELSEQKPKEKFALFKITAEAMMKVKKIHTHIAPPLISNSPSPLPPTPHPPGCRGVHQSGPRHRAPLVPGVPARALAAGAAGREPGDAGQPDARSRG